MTPLIAAAIVGGLLVVSVVIGAVLRARTGRIRAVPVSRAAAVSPAGSVSAAGSAEVAGVNETVGSTEVAGVNEAAGSSETAATSNPNAIDLSELGSASVLGERATLLQFSTQFCSICPGTARLLKTVAEASDSVTHVEVDLSDRPDLANRFAVLQTPTTLILDADGVPRARIGGAPRRQFLEEHLRNFAA